MTADEPTQRTQSGRVTVTLGHNGWEVSEERGDGVVRRASYRDWHRVERAVGMLALVEGLDIASEVPDQRTDGHRPTGSDDEPARESHEAIAESKQGFDLGAGVSEFRAKLTDVDLD